MEKLLQVMQSHIENANSISPTIGQMVEAAHKESLLVLIEEVERQTGVESKLADSCVDQRIDYAFYSGKAQALSQILESLRQARSELLQQQSQV